MTVPLRAPNGHTNPSRKGVISFESVHRQASYRPSHRPLSGRRRPMGRMRKGLWLSVGVLAVLTLQAGAAPAQKKTLVRALNPDPDILDPTLARTYVGRIIFAQMCEKLYEIDEHPRIHPPL